MQLSLNYRNLGPFYIHFLRLSDKLKNIFPQRAFKECVSKIFRILFYPIEHISLWQTALGFTFKEMLRN